MYDILYMSYYNRLDNLDNFYSLSHYNRLHNIEKYNTCHITIGYII